MRFSIFFLLAGLVASAPATLQAREDCPDDAYGALCPGGAPADAVCCDTRGVSLRKLHFSCFVYEGFIDLWMARSGIATALESSITCAWWIRETPRFFVYPDDFTYQSLEWPKFHLESSLHNFPSDINMEEGSLW